MVRARKRPVCPASSLLPGGSGEQTMDSADDRRRSRPAHFVQRGLRALLLVVIERDAGARFRFVAIRTPRGRALATRQRVPEARPHGAPRAAASVRLSAEGVTPTCDAAARKLRLSAAATRTRSDRQDQRGALLNSSQHPMKQYPIFIWGTGQHLKVQKFKCRVSVVTDVQSAAD
jgi:hypothetical protein